MAWDYRLGPRIGRGGMAEVFLAVQVGAAGFAKLVVLKRMRRDVAGRPELVRTLFDEARVLARLVHPNLVQVLDVGSDPDGPFVVVEYLPGETLLTVLRDLARAGQRVPWPVVCRIGADLAAGLAAAHEATGADGEPAPVLHRDLTPSNVILCYAGAVKLIDFGIAKGPAGVDTMVGMVKGKLSYLAPEILRGARPDARSDLFQLGVVLHESICGRRLFDGRDDAARVQAVLRRPVPPVGGEVASAPAALSRLVAALVERDPALRPASADEVRRSLEGVLSATGKNVTGHELGDWLRCTLPERHEERRRCERACLTLAGEDRRGPAGAGAHGVAAAGAPAMAGAGAAERASAEAMAAAQAAAAEPTTLSDGPVTTVLPAPRPPHRRWPWVAGVVIAAAALGGGAAAVQGEARPVPEPRGPIVAPLTATDAGTAAGVAVAPTSVPILVPQPVTQLVPATDAVHLSPEEPVPDRRREPRSRGKNTHRPRTAVKTDCCEASPVPRTDNVDPWGAL